jgi:hypothetical protein
VYWLPSGNIGNDNSKRAGLAACGRTSQLGAEMLNHELPLGSWRVPYAASGWMAAIFSYSSGDFNAAELCRRLTL